MESKYLERFSKIKNGDHFVLKGDKLIVEVLPKEEFKTAGGLFLQTDSNQVRNSSEENRVTLGLVLLTGSGFEDDEGNIEEPELKPGMVVLLAPESLRLFTQWPGLVGFTANEIALTRESHISMFWPSIDAYISYRTQLNS